MGLDPNHTHFILVDDGGQEYGKEQELRGLLEKKVCSNGVETQNPLEQEKRGSFPI